MDPDRFVFLDETGAATNMVYHGWGPKSERLLDTAPHGHWRTTTLVAGLRGTGVIAPLVLDGPMSGEAFRAYAEQFLAPALTLGDVVVMDKLGRGWKCHRERPCQVPPHASAPSLACAPTRRGGTSG
ncbi:hypothetical protein GCM10011504_57450 [Siccirubricoccus deserti]|uniref:Transposase n=1 Tax=Siccirubricoccus deserti TaxID=2013562 RepID=A0A9X0R6J5_9PROT|nr:transposase [Siccirubricoccus deserti]GGC72422.1 hypothetical protein GCM10011504_57450 [Siccirubricoccus deserti]